MTIIGRLNLKANPFEHYTAENEPDIVTYAVRPPYLQAIRDRAKGLSSFILFGDRGSGKSATRLTVYSDIWKEKADSVDEKLPFPVNVTDYSSLLPLFRKETLTDKDIVSAIAFVVIEQILAWLSSLEASDRAIFVEGLNKDERTLTYALLQGFYLSVPELDRQISNGEALKLLNSAWTTKSSLWIGRRWEALSGIVASLVSAYSKHQLDNDIDITRPAETLLKSLIGNSPAVPRAILSRLVEFVQSYGYSGVVCLVDKVDETAATSQSAEATAKLIYPILANIQLLEVPGFSWVMFLWSNVRTPFNNKYSVRLDKIANSNIEWNPSGLRDMVEARMNFFSNGKAAFSSLFEESIDPNRAFEELVELSTKSPRELIKLMDTIIREHDARGENAPSLIDQDSISVGEDKYAKSTIGDWFKDKTLRDVFRMGKTSFVNKDVQQTFKIGAQGARAKIKNWEDSGLVHQTGTVPSEAGAKPAYLFEIMDARVARIITRKLDEIVGAEIEGAPVEIEEGD